MRNLSMSSMRLLGVLIVLSAILLLAGCQSPTERTSNSTASDQFDPHDLSGIWARFGARGDRGSNQGGVPFPEGGDNGFGKNVPPFTPEGQEMFDAIKPGNGRVLGSPEALAHPEEHIGRRRAVAEKFQNDPTGQCTPSGLTRIILTTYFAPMEIIHARDRVIQHFDWTTDQRTIYTDGRKLPAEPQLLRWNGFSVGHWDRDTFVVESNGFQENSWLDQFGFPHSDQMRLEERYRRITPDRLELVMTLNDPKVYTTTWVGDKKTFRLLSAEEATIEEGWVGLLDNRCVPAEEFYFNQAIRNPAGGKVTETR